MSTKTVKLPEKSVTEEHKKKSKLSLVDLKEAQNWQTFLSNEYVKMQSNEFYIINYSVNHVKVVVNGQVKRK